MLKFAILLLTLCCLVALSDRKQGKRSNKPPVVEKIEATPSLLTFCDPRSVAEMYCDRANRKTVTLTATAKDPEGGSLNYKWFVSVGEILGGGSQVTWNLAGQKFGSHEAKVTVSDSEGDEATATLNVPIELCSMCGIPSPPCPNVVVNSYAEVAHRAEKIAFYTETSPGYFQSRPDYLWTIVGGRVLKGQHTPQVVVEVTGDISSEVIATVQVDGFDSACNTSAQASIRIRP